MLLMPIEATRAADHRNAPPKPFKPVIGGKFEEALALPLGLTWTDEEIGIGLMRLSETRQISILLDRRVDPGTKVSIDIQRAPFREILSQLTEQAGLGLSIVGNVIFIGPRATTARLRTVIELQSDQLISGVNSPNKPPLALLQKRSVEWNDFERPCDIALKVCDLFAVKVEGVDAIPHDLWRSGSIPNASPTQMLLLITAQFDLGIEWQPNGASVRIVPLLTTPTIERTYDVKTKPVDVAAAWQVQFPEIDITAKGTKLRVRATIEQHEHLAGALRNPRQVSPKNAPTATGSKAVTFTFEIKAAPLLAMMQAIESKSSFVFAYDSNELKAAGVDMNRKLDLKMTKASPAELFHAMFDESQIAFELDGSTVRLKPSKSP